MADLAWFTVVGAYADTKESYLVQVQVEDAVAAKAAGYRGADGVVIGLSVFPGRIDAVKDDTTITPLRDPGHMVPVSQVSVTEVRISIPSRCPSCKQDLRDPSALLCADLWLDFWHGHLTKDRDNVRGERDQSKLTGMRFANGARLQCASCNHLIHGDGIGRG